MKIRKPAVAGRFYPSGENNLREMLELTDQSLIEPRLTDWENKEIVAGIVPHAGYIYSGKIAAPFFKILPHLHKEYDLFILLHPNHYGKGPSIACDVNEAWETPLGLVEIDKSIPEKLGLAYSLEAHQSEHSCEVLIPFLQYYLPYRFMILPVAMYHTGFAECLKLALQLLRAIKETDKNILIIASTDFSHFVSAQSGARQDDRAIEFIYRLDAEGFYNTVRKDNLSICGFEPVATLLSIVSGLQPEAIVQMLARGHSGGSDLDEDVVHYASFIIS